MTCQKQKSGQWLERKRWHSGKQAGPTLRWYLEREFGVRPPREKGERTPRQSLAEVRLLLTVRRKPPPDCTLRGPLHEVHRQARATAALGQEREGGFGGHGRVASDAGHRFTQACLRHSCKHSSSWTRDLDSACSLHFKEKFRQESKMGRIPLRRRLTPCEGKEQKRPPEAAPEARQPRGQPRGGGNAAL